MTNPPTYVRLFFTGWAVFFLWLAVFQFSRRGWMWALGDLLLAGFGVWVYAESIIEELKDRSDATQEQQKEAEG